MRYRTLSRVTEPAVEPVTLAEAKQHLRVDTNDDDGLIHNLIRAAREWVEAYLDRSLVYTQWQATYDTFPWEFDLPRPPMAAAGTATATAITYTLETGSTATLSSATYRVDRAAVPGVVRTVYGGTWPGHLNDQNAISVTWWGGYGANATDVPQGIRNAMLLYIAELYEKRGSGEPPAAAKALLDAYKWGSYR